MFRQLPSHPISLYIFLKNNRFSQEIFSLKRGIYRYVCLKILFFYLKFPFELDASENALNWEKNSISLYSCKNTIKKQEAEEIHRLHT